VKGQEWPLVVLHHAEADQYPHRLAEDFEEERRVFHVAITRGAEQVVVVAGKEPSPYIEQMLNEPPDRLADPTPRRPAMVTPVPKSSKAPARDTRFEKGVVFAAPGLVLIDGGQEWIIEAVEDQAALARLGSATRRFNFGGSVATPGRQRGPLRAAPADGPAMLSAANVRAHDLLRQARERLRSGKPAYVVFDDKTLEAIALRLPITTQDLGQIPGIGPAKLEQYGDEVLLAIEDALAEPERSS